MAINLADFNKIWASTSPLTPYSFSEANYKRGWNFVGSTPPARQMWDSYMKASDEKHQWLYNNKLSLSGGTLTGNISFSQSTVNMVLTNANYDGSITIYGGANGNTGAGLRAYGKNHSTEAGAFWLHASDGTKTKQLRGYPDGTLFWGGGKVFYGESNINANYKDGWTIDRTTNTLQQWKRQSINAGASYTWTFAKPFDTDVYITFLTSNIGTYPLTITARTATSMTIQNNGSGQAVVNMMVIGISAS